MKLETAPLNETDHESALARTDRNLELLAEAGSGLDAMRAHAEEAVRLAQAELDGHQAMLQAALDIHDLDVLDSLHGKVREAQSTLTDKTNYLADAAERVQAHARARHRAETERSWFETQQSMAKLTAELDMAGAEAQASILNAVGLVQQGWKGELELAKLQGDLESLRAELDGSHQVNTNAVAPQPFSKRVQQVPALANTYQILLKG